MRGDLTGRVVNKERLFVTIRWDDGTVTSTHRYDMDDINRPSPPKPPPGNTVAIIKRLQNGEIYSEIAKRYGVTRQRVQFIAKRAGLTRQKPGAVVARRAPTASNEGLRRRGPRPPTERNAAVVAALKKGLTYKEIAKQHGMLMPRIREIAKKYGIQNKSKLEIALLIKETNMTYVEIAKRFDVSFTRISYIAKEYNIQRRGEKNAAIAAAVKAGESYRDIGRRYGLTHQHIRRITNARKVDK